MARTLRAMGCGLSDLGGAVTWGEAHTLLKAAAVDTSTHLGAELAGWAYPASMPELLGILGTVGKGAIKARLMPWQMAEDAGKTATPDEVAEANAEYEAELIFT